MLPHPRWNVLACSLLLSACAGAPAASPPAGPAPSDASSARRSALPAAAGALEGRVMAPANVLGGARLIGADGASLIGADGASLIGPDGASLIGLDGASLRAGRGLLAIAERGLAGAEVVVADAAGKPLPGVKPATTDADGRFKLAGVPAGAYRLQAGVRTAKGVARLEALVRSDAGAGKADVSAASTLVTRLVAAAPQAAAMDMDRWTEAVAACARALDDQALPEWGDPAGVERAARATMASSAEMRPVVEALARDMGMAMGAAPAPSPSPAAASPAPAPSVAPSAAAPSVAPSPSPTPTPSPVTEYHDPRAEFRKTAEEASQWSYYWLDGPVPKPMAVQSPGAPSITWLGGTETRPEDTVAWCTVFADDLNFYLDPSTTRMEGAAAAWTAPVAGTARVTGYFEVNAHTVNGVTVSLRNGDVELVSRSLTPTLQVDRLDTGYFQVPAGGKVWFWAQPNAMPEVTDIVRIQARIEFNRPGP